MPTYTIEVRCRTCAADHPLHVMVTLDDGPSQKESVGKVYAGKEIPKPLEDAIRTHVTFCEQAGKFLAHHDTQSYDDYVLVPCSL